METEGQRIYREYLQTDYWKKASAAAKIRGWNAPRTRRASRNGDSTPSLSVGESLLDTAQQSRNRPWKCQRNQSRR
jgi:hypothetical protein